MDISLSTLKNLFLNELYNWSNPKIPNYSIQNNVINHHNKTKHSTPVIYNQSERSIIKTIKEQTKRNNVNNITRTTAYMSFYSEHPEIHWAFLAHMVSRNGGYYMTDLKASLLSEWLSVEEQDRYFMFLERSNAYIFYDAYPQLCLYALSKKQGKPLFHLLPAFDVSSFMQPHWNSFYQQKESRLLTVALIINEQFMLEERVIKGIYQSKSILSELPFQVQENLGFTNIYFPYRLSKSYRYRLCGKTVNHFADVRERIQIGKILYQLLFFPKHLLVTFQYAKQQAHTGSRSDYWPKFYTSDPKNQNRFYSARLQDVWDNTVISYPHLQDWYNSHILIRDEDYDLPAIRNYDLTSHAIKNFVLLKTLTTIQK